jgi:hypothetical protein
MLRRLTFAFLLGFLSMSRSAQAQASEWNFVKEEQAVKVYKRDVEDSALKAMRGETVINAPIDKLLWVLFDNEHRTEWVDRLVESKILTRKNSHEYIVYQRFHLSSLMSDRDYVYHGRAHQLSTDGAVRLSIQSVTHPQAPETVGIRAELIHTHYTLTPLGDGRTRVEVEVLTDPKGWLPAWLVNLIQQNWPVKTLDGLRVQVAKPFVGSLPLPAKSE